MQSSTCRRPYACVVPSHRPVRLFYIDDSGAEKNGIVTFSWVELSVDDWRKGIGAVLGWRGRLNREHEIPKRYEIHMTDFANGRGNPSAKGDVWNRRKANRSEVLDEAFGFFARWEWMSVGTVYSLTTAKRVAFRDEKIRVYGKLLQILQDRLEETSEWGLVFMDGDGSDHSYTRAHRDLPLDSRLIVEDPLFQDSGGTLWMQMADIVAYAGYEHIMRLEAKKFAWDWYATIDPELETIYDVTI